MYMTTGQAAARSHSRDLLRALETPVGLRAASSARPVSLRNAYAATYGPANATVMAE